MNTSVSFLEDIYLLKIANFALPVHTRPTRTRDNTRLLLWTPITRNSSPQFLIVVNILVLLELTIPCLFTRPYPIRVMWHQAMSHRRNVPRALWRLAYAGSHFSLLPCLSAISFSIAAAYDYSFCPCAFMVVLVKSRASRTRGIECR